MTSLHLSRRAALLLPLLLAACGGSAETPPPSFAPPNYDYLSKLRLDVGEITIDDSWAPRGAERHVEYLAPTPPLDALRKMAQDRLVPAGSRGRALFTIEDASIVQMPDSYDGNLAVRLDITDSDGNPAGSAVARVTKSRPRGDDTPEAVRVDLYDLVRALMDDMNVEFQYQVQRTLKNRLEPAAGVPAPVQSEDLNAPAPTTP
jgi:hypothetical protein